MATEEHNLNTWQDEIITGVSNFATFSETFAGAWGTFDIEILVSAVTANTPTPAAMILFGAGDDLTQDGFDISFSVVVTNSTLNANYTVENLTFTSIKYNAGNGASDSATLVGPWGNQTWTDANNSQGITGHDTGTSRFDVNALNTGNPVTAYSSQYESDSFRIIDIKATAEVHLVPEPSSTALLGLGSLALLARRRR